MSRNVFENIMLMSRGDGIKDEHGLTRTTRASIEHHVAGGAVLVAAPQAVPGAQITLVRRAVVTASRTWAQSRD